MKFYKVIKIYLNNVFNEFELLNVDSMTYSEQIQNKKILNTGTIYYNNRNKKFSGGGNSYPERGKINLIGDIEEIYQYIGKGAPTEFIAEESTERDYYTKLETNNLLDKKQDKLIAGTNITIDENNKISATGGKVDLSDYYKKSVFMKGYFTYKDDRDQLWINDSSNSSLAISLLLNNTYGRLETNNKNIVGAVNEINKKQVKENWKVIGKSINNRKYGDFNLAFNTLYRVIITWESPPFHQVNTRITVEFKTGNYLGGNHGIKIFLTKGLINNEECILYLQLLDINKWQLILEGGNEKYANIFSLEELQNTVKVDIIQPIKITSHTLKINELKNNEINIELPNTPTPTPNISQWKEVGEVITDKNNNNQNFIKYIFKDKTHYRIYISYGDYTSKENNKNYSWQIINFYYQLDTSVVKSSLWIANNNNNQQTEINIYNNRIMWGMGRDYIFKKLEELQE
ncbi:hypothetical protein [Spiroplasma endosymbiont of Villa modesta]|uniref:hypothetical protein n=1 Tax=Spiroplasma endosymbiont of Villa modesta TaxID=3066293 RepID=UPI00313B5025